MPELTESSGQWLVRGSAFEAAFDTATGTIVSYRFEGAELLQMGPEPTFWRAMTDNDRGSNCRIGPRYGEKPVKSVPSIG